MDLDDIRLKEVTELSDTEKKALNENWDKLTEEEQKYFGEVKSKEGGDEGFKMDFKTQEEFDKYLNDKVEATIEARKKAKLEEKKKTQTPDEDRIFPEGFKAKDWNEAFTMALPKIEQRVINNISKMSNERKEKLAKIESEYDKELDSIVKSNKDLPQEGKEREDWEAEVAQVGVDYKLTSMKDAYKVWQAVKGTTSDNSNGEDRVQIPIEGQPANQDNKRIASKVGKGYGTSNASKKTRYTPGQRLDDLLEKRMREEGIEP